MPYGFRIELDGVDITDKVSRFEITASLESYVREVSVDLADADLYDSLDFSVLPDEPTLEVFTQVDSSWVSQGLFFVEKPTYKVGTHSTTTGLWGRSETARLGSPFAAKISKTWETDTTFFAICDELCTAAGLTWDEAYSDIPDFTVYAFTFQVSGSYPCEVISQLLELAYAEDAFLTTDAAGHICIRLLDRSPAVADQTITDPVVASISEEPEWPDFANRIKISASGALSGYSISLWAPSECLQADGETQVKMYARVSDQNGDPVDNVPVAWASKSGLVTLARATSNAGTVTIHDEEVRSKSWYEIDVQFPPDDIVGVWAYRDTGKTVDLAEAGYTVDGQTITLTNPLTYCDQLVRVSYTCRGVSVNRVTAGSTAGTDTVTASLAGNQDSKEFYLDNPCKCPPSITVKANPTSIKVGEAALILVYVEIGNAPVTDGRTVYMTMSSNPVHGGIEWTKSRLGNITVSNEQTESIKEVSGLSQCEISMFPDSVSGVWLSEEDIDGNIVAVGSSIYSSHSGKLINLSVNLDANTPLLVAYTAMSAAVNVYDGINSGTDQVRAFILTSREEPTEGTVSITVTKEGDADDPTDCCDGGLCASDQIPCDEVEITCADGAVHGKSGGTDGCWTAEQIDTCGEGQVYCYKDGTFSCYDLEDCDTTYQVQTVHGYKDGVNGCWIPEELDACGAAADGKVYCFKDQQAGCNAPEDCDTGTFTAEPQNCSGSTVCCYNKDTGLKGCWPSGQCIDNPNDDKPKDDKPWDNIAGQYCHKRDGTAVKCKKGEACCEKGGVRGCWPWRECDVRPDYCYPIDCSKKPSPDCLQTRFAKGLQDGGDGCSCFEMCDKEFSKLGTTQGYDNHSYVPISVIAIKRYGTVYQSPEYWEVYDALKEDAMADCQSQCEDCSTAEALVLSGPETATKPAGIQYLASGGMSPYEWTVTGAGATIDSDGYVTLGDEACGSISVSVSDQCGFTATVSTRITNAGSWQMIDSCNAACSYYVGCYSTCISGKYKVYNWFGGYPYATCGSFSCGDNCLTTAWGSVCTLCVAENSYCAFQKLEWKC